MPDGQQLHWSLRSRVLALAGACWRASPWVTTGLLMSAVASALAGPIAALATKRLLDGLVAGAGWLGPVLVVVATAALLGLLAPTGDFLRTELGRAVSVEVPDQLFRSLERVELLSWFDDAENHDTLQLAQQAGSQVSSLLLRGGIGLIQSCLSIAGFVVVLVGISPWFTLLMLVSAVPALVAQLLLSRARARVTRSLGRAHRRRLFFQMLLSDQHAIKEIRLFGSGPYLRGRMTAELRTIARAERTVDARLLRTETVLALLSAAVVAVVLAATAHDIATGRRAIGDMPAVLASAVGIQAAAAVLVGQLSQANEGLILFDSFLDIARLPVEDAAVVHELAPLSAAIEFEDVWFRYPGADDWTLAGLTLTIPAGRTTALVGLNGAGKSTLVKLLCRFYEPTKGVIRWDGVDLDSVDPRALRTRLSGVFQDFMNYDLTARENIELGDVSRRGDAEGTRQAARRAGVETVLDRLPDAFDTPLTRIYFGEQDRADSSTGVVLSGGQWQRLAVARGLFRSDADLIILDEPTAGLDPEAEMHLRAELVELRRGRTTLLISHRLGGLRHADRIAVVADGVCVETGNHSELMAAGGRYADLFLLQAEDYRDALPAELVPVPDEGPDELPRDRSTTPRTRSTPIAPQCRES